MISSVKVTKAGLTALTMPLVGPTSTSPFHILSIDGLGPTKSNINILDRSMYDGGVFSSARTGARNITLGLYFLETTEYPTIEAVRLLAGKYFTPGSMVTLDITTSAGVFYIDGYVESNEPNIFSRYQTTSISILCPDPAFRKRSEAAVTAGLGSITMAGTIPTPPHIVMTATGPITAPVQIDFTHGSITRSFVISVSMVADDVLDIQCEPGNKHILLNSINKLHTLAAWISIWPMIYPGTNVTTISTPTGGELPNNATFTYHYSILYSGI